MSLFTIVLQLKSGPVLTVQYPKFTTSETLTPWLKKMMSSSPDHILSFTDEGGTVLIPRGEVACLVFREREETPSETMKNDQCD